MYNILIQKNTRFSVSKQSSPDRSFSLDCSNRSNIRFEYKNMKFYIKKFEVTVEIKKGKNLLVLFTSIPCGRSDLIPLQILNNCKISVCWNDFIAKNRVCQEK